MSKFAAMGLLLTTGLAGGETVVVGYADYRPLMSQRADGTPGGFAFDVLNEAARREGILIGWRFVDKQTPDAALASGHVDLWPAAIDSSERRARFHVTTAWWRNELLLLTIAENRLRTMSALRGRRVSSVKPFQPQVRSITGAVWVAAGSHEAAADMVCSGAVDAAILDRLRLDRMLLWRTTLCRDKIFDVLPMPDASIELSILAKPSHARVADALRRRIDEIAADGTLATIALRHPPISSASADRIAAAVSARYDRQLLRIAIAGSALLLAASALVIYVLISIGGARKRALLRLEESEARFRVLVDAMPQFVWSVRRDGACEFLSARWFQYTGASADCDWFDAVHPDDREPTRSSLLATLQAGQSWHAEYRLRRHDGQYRWFEARGVPVKAASGGEMRWIGASSDIDDSKRAAENLRLRHDHLQQFAWAVSHDLQEPLRMVITFTQLLQRRFAEKLGADGGDFIAHAVSGAYRIESLLHDLRDYWSVAGDRTGTGEPVDLASAAEDAVRNLQTAIAEAGASVEIGTLPVVMAERAAIVTLLQNLVSNAVKYRRSDRGSFVRVTAIENGDSATVRVEDNGIGIDPKYRDEIFHVFKRLHSRGEYPGNGIGLALCRRIVERHGGTIWVESEQGLGSTFCFTLPVVKSESPSTIVAASGV